MICPPRIEAVLNERGFTVVAERGCFVIKNSELIPLECIEVLLKNTGSQPFLVNHNRLGPVEFTVFPYKIPDFFQETLFFVVPGLVDSIWKKVESIPPSPPMSLGDEQRLSNGVIEFFAPFDIDKGNALDLGCGKGINSLQLARFHWKVTAVELDKRYLQAIKAKRPEIECIHGDMTELKFKSHFFHLVVATEVFPYLKPATWKKTLEKIHDWMAEGAHFVGTFFIDTPMSRLQNEKGAHLIDRGEEVVAMLESTRFSVKKASLKRSNLENMLLATGLDPNHPLVKSLSVPCVVEFVAQKPLAPLAVSPHSTGKMIEKEKLQPVKP